MRLHGHMVLLKCQAGPTGYAGGPPTALPALATGPDVPVAGAGSQLMGVLCCMVVMHAGACSGMCTALQASPGVMQMAFQQRCCWGLRFWCAHVRCRGPADGGGGSQWGPALRVHSLCYGGLEDDSAPLPPVREAPMRPVGAEGADGNCVPARPGRCKLGEPSAEQHHRLGRLLSDLGHRAGLRTGRVRGLARTGEVKRWSRS